MDYPAGYTEGESKYSIFCGKCEKYLDKLYF